jgi:hypothetical protein
LKVSVRKPYCGSTTIPYKSTEIPDDSFPSFRQMTTAISSDIMERDKLSIRAIYHSDGSKIIETFSLSLSLSFSLLVPFGGQCHSSIGIHQNEINCLLQSAAPLSISGNRSISGLEFPVPFPVREQQWAMIFLPSPAPRSHKAVIERQSL